MKNDETSELLDTVDTMEMPAEQAEGSEERHICSICGNDDASTELFDGFICDECREKTPQFHQRFWMVSSKQAREQMEMKKVFDDRASRFEVTDRHESFILVDKVNRLIQAYATDNDSCHSTVYLQWEDLVSFQLVADGKVVSRRDSGDTKGFEALLGASESAVGTVGGSRFTNVASEIAIKLVTRNAFYPQIKINLLAFPTFVGSKDYHKATANAQKILALLTDVADSI